MSKLIPMEEAAKLLGMSVERLTELRSNNEIFGYRDGSTWKFKRAELERVAGELGIRLQGDNSEDALDLSDDLGFDLTESSKAMITDEDSSSGSLSEIDSAIYIEDSSVELFQDTDEKSEKVSSDDDSINLDEEDSAIRLSDSGRLASGTSKKLTDDELNLEGGSDVLASDEKEGDELSFGSSSLKLASEGSSKKMKGDGSSPDLLDDEPQKKDSPSDTGKMLEEGLADEDDLLMSEDDLFSDDLSFSDSASFEDSAELSSDFEDSEVLEDSDSSTEITLEANESGINLSANESGISLADEPLELGGSDIDALELPEDDDMIVLEDAAGPDQATMMQEDEFNLTPLEESVEDESSGSQVIALEDSEIYADESGSLVSESEEFEAQPALLDEPMGGDLGYDPSIDPGQMMVPAGAAPAGLPEAPYSVAQVVGLGLVTLLLVTGGMVAYNVAQNMWMPDDQIIGKGVLNFFLRLTGMDEVS